MRILVLTVGGSPSPVINAYCEFQPDFTYFVCSRGTPPVGTEEIVDGPGDPCGDKRTQKCPECGYNVPLGNPEGKSIVEQLKIPKDAYTKVVLEDPDDLEEVYQAMLFIHKEVKELFPYCQKAISYTGGTKNMTAGGVLLGIQYPEWELAIQKGPRRDLAKVERGDTWWPVNAISIYADIQLEIYNSLLENYEYDTVKQLLQPLLMNRTLPKPKLKALQHLRRLCEAFSLWDRFDHNKALELLDVLGGETGPWVRLARILAGKVKKPSPYQAVADLVLNAQRRKKQVRHDDAVARLYRAVEMLAQVRLKNVYKIETGKIILQDLPDTVREKYCERADKNGEIKLPLSNAYQLLFDLNDDLGKLWCQHRSEMINALEIRNFSILAHGIRPIEEARYMVCGNVLQEFIKEGLKVCQAQIEWMQLPTTELIKMMHY